MARVDGPNASEHLINGRSNPGMQPTERINRLPVEYGGNEIHTPTQYEPLNVARHRGRRTPQARSHRSVDIAAQ